MRDIAVGLGSEIALESAGGGRGPVYMYTVCENCQALCDRYTALPTVPRVLKNIHVIGMAQTGKSSRRLLCFSEVDPTAAKVTLLLNIVMRCSVYVLFYAVEKDCI